MQLRNFIRFLLQERIRSKTFDMNTFRDLIEDSPQQAVRYCHANLKFLGSGSSRHVFLLSSQKVLKVAYDQYGDNIGSGIAQNEAEVDVYTNPLTKPIVAKIFDFDPDYLYIVSELVRAATEADAKKLFGTRFFWPLLTRVLETGAHDDQIAEQIARHFHHLNVNPTSEQLGNLFNIIKTTLKLVNDNKLMHGDLTTKEHWGMTSDGRIVLLDYGFTRQVARDHYNYSVDSKAKTK